MKKGGETRPPIETRGLTKFYGSTVAVDRLDLRVETGQVYGLLGPNGAGKTTTLKMLLGLVHPTSGEAWLFGRSCRSPASRQSGTVGALIDEPAFYPFLTGRQNLEILCTLSGSGHDEINTVLDTVGLGDVADKSYQTYSHGMRQRLGIAAALLPRPRLLILDEPASGLDPAGIREGRQLLRRLSEQNITILLSSHLLHEVQATCSHVGLMFNGRLVASGRVDELLSREVSHVKVQVDDPSRAMEILRAEGFEAEPTADGALSVPAGASQAADINATLVAAGLRVFALVPHSPTLEDLYMEYADRADGNKGNAR